MTNRPVKLIIRLSKYLKKMLNEFGKQSYIAEISIEDNSLQRQYNNFIINMANKYSMALIFSNEIYYPKKEDNVIQDVLQSVSQKKSIKKSRTKENRGMYYLGMEDVFEINKEFGFNYDEKFLKTCFITSEKLSSICNFDFEINVEKYPNYKATEDVVNYFKTENTEELIHKLSHAKLNQKLKK